MEFPSLRIPQWHLRGSLDWAWSTSIFTTIFARCHCIDFIFMRYIKGKVSATHVPELSILWPPIHDVTATVIVIMTDKTWTEIDYIWSLLNSTNRYINSWVSLPDAKNCILSAVTVSGGELLAGISCISIQNNCAMIYFISVNYIKYAEGVKRGGRVHRWQVGKHCSRKYFSLQQ
jgi:hypothetical protein